MVAQPHRPRTTWRAALSERATRGARAGLQQPRRSSGRRPSWPGRARRPRAERRPMAAPRPQPHRPRTTWRAALSERATRGARARGCNSRGSLHALLHCPTGGLARCVGGRSGRVVPTVPAALDVTERRSRTATWMSCAGAAAQSEPPDVSSDTIICVSRGGCASI